MFERSVIYILGWFGKGDGKVRDFMVTTKCFGKFFLKKFFFGKLDKRGEVDGGEVLWVVGGLGGVR